MAINITDALLRRLCQLNAFPFDEDEMLFFGLRGCVPSNPNDQTWGKTRIVDGSPLNYRNPRCVLGQWLPADKEIAIFPGSTVPTAKYIEAAIEDEGDGANQLFTGRYEFAKGIHRKDTPIAHKAFTQIGSRIFLRTADDSIYEFSDRVDTGNPFDNLHAAFETGLSGTYLSAGCQVVTGTPYCEVADDSGPWVTFRDNAYESSQGTFDYLLFDSKEADRWDDHLDETGRLKIRCGSVERALPAGHEDTIRTVQEKLQEGGFYDGIVDGDFGPKSTLAAIKFQRKELGVELADGIVGGTTALALGLTDWPTVA